jgi:hypothetical protein
MSAEDPKARPKKVSNWIIAHAEDIRQWEAEQQDMSARDALIAKWYSPRTQAHRHKWERVQELRARFGETKTVAAIWEIVAKEMRTTAAAISQSCKRVKRLHNSIERLNKKLGMEWPSRF